MKKNSKYVTVMKTDSNREYFMRHGLHMNMTGKEVRAQQIAATSIALFQGEKDNSRNIKGNNMKISIQMMTKILGKAFPKMRLTNTTTNERGKTINSIQFKNVYGYDEVSMKIKKKKVQWNLDLSFFNGM